MVELADLFNGRFQFLIVGKATLYIGDLFPAQADLPDAATGIAYGEHRHGMTFASVALGAAGAVADDAFEQRSTEDVAGLGEACEEAVAIADGLLMIHQ